VYYSLRGATYLIGAPIAQIVQSRLGPVLYTNFANGSVIVYLLTKAYSTSFTGQLVSGLQV
jgi:hypothetical protein